MIEQSPILITGCPRSGASMIATAIQACGVFGGEMSKRGMFNNDRICYEIVQPYFTSIKSDPKGQNPLPNINDLLIPVKWREKVEAIISQQNYQKGQWMYKDSRSALIWPIWNYAYPNAKWIIVRRNTEDIIQSCLKTGYMSSFRNHIGWLRFVRQYEERFREMIEIGVNCKVVWPERMVDGDYKQMYETIAWLGLNWSTKVVDLIDPMLWNSRQKERRAL